MNFEAALLTPPTKPKIICLCILLHVMLGVDMFMANPNLFVPFYFCSRVVYNMSPIQGNVLHKAHMPHNQHVQLHVPNVILLVTHKVFQAHTLYMVFMAQALFKFQPITTATAIEREMPLPSNP